MLFRSTLVLTWEDGGTKTARDDGNGSLTGDMQGSVDYLNGVISTARYINSNSVEYTCEETRRISASVVGGAGYGMTAEDKGAHWELVFKDATPNQSVFRLDVKGQVSEETDENTQAWPDGDCSAEVTSATQIGRASCRERV